MSSTNGWIKSARDKMCHNPANPRDKWHHIFYDGSHGPTSALTVRRPTRSRHNPSHPQEKRHPKNWGRLCGNTVRPLTISSVPQFLGVVCAVARAPAPQSSDGPGILPTVVDIALSLRQDMLPSTERQVIGDLLDAQQVHTVMLRR